MKRVSLALALVSMLSVGVWTSSVQARPSTLPDFVSVVEDSSAAVVNISTTQKVKPRTEFPHGRGLPEGTPFDDFFRRFFDEREMPERDAHSLGSGFVVTADGYILTNNHVVQDADEIIVKLSDRRELKAELVGSDERSDVALLKVDAENLPVVKIGDVSKLKVGEWVLAIGSPFDFDHTVTAGIISALGRALPNENYVPFIQTDVAINPGNSGGPLFNMDGEVIGVNAQIYSRTGGFMGLSFAIPIDLAMGVVDQLKNNGHVTRGWLGVLIQDVDRELAESLGMTKPEGALVSQVLKDSPAEAAGIAVGDVILEFGGREVSNSAALPPMVGITAVDKETEVKVMREGKVTRLSVVIGELPADDELREASVGKGDSAKTDRLGLRIEALTAEQRDELDLGDKGVLVADVKEGPAYNAGIRAGDVIVMVDHKNVTDISQFKALIEALPVDKAVAFLIQRRGGPLFLAVRLPKAE